MLKLGNMQHHCVGCFNFDDRRPNGQIVPHIVDCNYDNKNTFTTTYTKSKQGIQTFKLWSSNSNNLDCFDKRYVYWIMNFFLESIITTTLLHT